MKNDYRYIEIQHKGQIIGINLNRPERHNALILEMIDELDQALEEISGMNEVLFCSAVRKWPFILRRRRSELVL